MPQRPHFFFSLTVKTSNNHQNIPGEGYPQIVDKLSFSMDNYSILPGYTQTFSSFPVDSFGSCPMFTINFSFLHGILRLVVIQKI